jgi:chromate transporter
VKKQRPQSLKEIFWRFSWLSLQGFGGVFPVAQRELVEKYHWLTKEEFVEDWAVAQVMPGPNVVNLGLIIGSRFFGIKGGLVALFGLIIFPLILVITLIFLYSSNSHNSHVIGALRGMAAVAAGMIAGTSLKLASTFKSHPLKSSLCWLIVIACLVCVTYLKLQLIYALLIFGLSTIYLTYRKIPS